MMRRVSLMVSSTFLVAASFAAGTAAGAPGADVYGAQPELSHVSLSPDGAHIAMFAPQGDTGGVRIAKVGGASCAFGAGKVKFRNIFWANPDRLIVEVSFTFSGDKATNDPKYMFEIYRAISVNARCEDSKDLLAGIKNIGQITGGNFMGATPDGQRVLFSAINVNRRARDPDTRLKGISTSTYDVYAIDPATGTSEKIEAGSNKTIGWFVDGAGVLRMRTDRKNETNNDYVVLARIGDSKDWALVYDSASVTDKSRYLGFVAVSARGDVAYVTTRNGGDKYGIYEFDLKTKAVGRKLLQSARVDADRLLLDNNSQRAVGVSYVDDTPIEEYFDNTYAQMQADLAATFPGERVEIRSVSKDQKKFIAYVEGAQNPGGAYHFVDMTIPEMTKIGSRYSSLTAADIAPVKALTYQARDGMTIPAYLTLPPGSSGKGLPLVVYPHGGPQSRDDASFDPYVQFLATRGYAVLQPQFRGSSGFGARHLEAGYFKWGLEMQNDITDGVKHLAANGTVDPSKVCIFGFSYGGYAAMAGLTFTPDVYKCGVSGAGPSDLLLLVGDVARRSEFSYLGTDGWREWIGDPTRDQKRLIATSPVKHVERITAPLLLIHGADDIVVPLRQSTVMVDAMKEAGKPVELIVIQGDDHWLSRASTNKRVLQDVDRFLRQHLK
jgi:dipeptidyl aminopeptidase/acylaminoacyl peptidase